jgi:NAD(P)-dependent dehydrogenase (short-subunit alcohol dehydrogenase family)
MKKIIITGGTSGIGLEIAKRLLTLNYHVHLLGRNFSEAEFLNNFRKYKDNIKVSLFNINSLTEVKNFFHDNNEMIDGIIHSVGITDVKIFEESDLMLINEVMQTNLISLINFNQLAFPILKKNENTSIIHISSACSLYPCATVAYSVSKAGLDMLTKCLAIEWQKYKIRVNSINPAITKTPFHINNNIVEDCNYDKWLSDMKINNIHNEIINTEEIAHCVEFLLNEKSSSITGTILPIGALSK